MPSAFFRGKAELMIRSFQQALRVFDHHAIRFVPRVQRAWLAWPMKVLTYSGSSGSWIATSTLLTLLNQVGVVVFLDQERFLAAMLGSLASLIAGQILKKIFRRRRPHLALPHEVLDPDDRVHVVTQSIELGAAVRLGDGDEALERPLVLTRSVGRRGHAG